MVEFHQLGVELLICFGLQEAGAGHEGVVEFLQVAEAIREEGGEDVGRDLLAHEDRRGENPLFDQGKD